MKNTKNWMILMALLAAGNTVATLPAQARGSKNMMERESNRTISLDGEQIVLGGRTYTLSGSADVRSSVKQKGGTTTVKFHYDPQHATLMAPNGQVYRFSGASNTTARVGTNGGSFMSVANFRLVGTGKGNKMRLHVTMKGHVDSSGNVTFDKSTYDLV